MLSLLINNDDIYNFFSFLLLFFVINFRPGKENLDSSYRMALQAGRHGADCTKLFITCPKGSSLLDQYIDEL